MESEAESELSADTSVTIPYSNEASSGTGAPHDNVVLGSSPTSLDGSSNMPILLQAVDIAANRDLLLQRKRSSLLMETNGGSTDALLHLGSPPRLAEFSATVTCEKPVQPSNGTENDASDVQKLVLKPLEPTTELRASPSSLVGDACCSKDERSLKATIDRDVTGSSKGKVKKPRVVYGPRTKVPTRLFGKRRRKVKDKDPESCDLAEVGEKFSNNESIHRYWLESKSTWPYRAAAKPPRVGRIRDDLLERPPYDELLLTGSKEDYSVTEKDDGNDYFEFYIDRRLLRVTVKDAMWFSARSVSLRFLFLRSADFWPPAPLGSRALQNRRLLIEGIQWHRFSRFLTEIHKVGKEYGDPLWYAEDEILRNVKVVDASGIFGEIFVGAALLTPPPGLHGPIEPIFGLSHDHLFVDELFTRLLDIEASRRCDRWLSIVDRPTETNGRGSDLLTLPDSVLLRILLLLPSDDRRRMARVCRRLRELVAGGSSEEAIGLGDSLRSEHGSATPSVLSSGADS